MSTTLGARPLEEIDLTDLALFADGPPLAVFRRLRDEAPVHRNRSAAGAEFWSLTRFSEIQRVNKDWETFSSARRGVTIDAGSVFPREMEQGAFVLMDPPEHDKHRAIVGKVFTPRVVREHEPRMRRIINDLLDVVIERGECDFVDEIAVEFPLTLIAEMLGVPAADRRQLFAWTNRIAEVTTPAEGTELMVNLGGYVYQLVTERRANPGDDLLSLLLAAEVDGLRLTDLEVTAHFAQLMAAGNETTRNGLAGGLLALIEHPDEMRKLIERPELMSGAVEEILRWHTPVTYQARTATRAVELAGTPIEQGELVVMWFASGNRDERTFPEPDRFDVTRAGEKQIAFGAGGRHFCIGSQLARIELRVALEEVLRRMHGITLAGPVRREPTNVFNWLRAMPISFAEGPKERS